MFSQVAVYLLQSHVGYAYVAGDNDISFVRIRLPMSEELCRNRLPHYVVGDAMDAKGNRVFTLSDGRSGGIRVVSDKNGDVARLDFPAADPQTAFLGGRLGGAFRPYDLVAAAAKTGVNAPEYGPAAVVQTRTLNTEALVSQVQLLRRAAVLNKADMAALRELHVNRHDSRDWDPTDLRRPLTSATILNAERYMAEFGRLEKTLAHIQRCSEYLALSGIPNVTLPCPPDASQMSADSLRQTAECMTQIAREAQSRNRASPAELSLIGVYMDKGVPMVLMEHGGEGRRIAIKFDKFVDNAARYQEFGALLSDAKAIKASVFPDGAISIIGVPTEEEAAALRAQAASVNPRQTPIQRKHG